MKIGIIGEGHVGGAMHGLFTNATVYDEPKQIGSRDEINSLDIVFVCVPTPMGKNGECDTSIVEDVLSWVNVPNIVIRSTVPVGFTEKWQEIKKDCNLFFQPEYYGETTNHPFADLTNRRWITIGGRKGTFDSVIEAYQSVYTSDIYINLIDSKTAELAKYMENCFLATKVTFCNEFYDIAEKMGVDYNQLRETWCLDPRIGKSHTFVYKNNRGYSGSCLPKDLSSMIYQADSMDCDVTLLKSVRDKNNKLKE